MALLETTNSLKETLSNTKARGQWGERMAEDVLRIAGFIENINYLKQKKIDEIGTKPDYTFLLPKDMKLNMDVKFPMENYVKYTDADSELEKDTYRKKFLSDVKERIKEVTTRDYINPKQNTVDYVLLFIPNEQIYAFIHTEDQAILEDSLNKKVILCSPITMFAILAVIRKAVDNFALEKTSNEIISLLGKFYKNWEKFTEKMGDVGKGIEDAQTAYDELLGVRKRQLERSLNKIEEIREQRGLPTIDSEGDELKEE
jgi:DNA recombination protein RmuC